MTDFTLYYFPGSGNCYKVALMLQLCGASWQGEWVNLAAGEHKSPAWLKVNEMGEVPAIVDHTNGDLTLSQSGAILGYLADRTGKFGGRNMRERLEINRWILYDNHRISSELGQLRRLRRFENTPVSDPVYQYLAGRATVSLGVLDSHLRDNEWVVGNSPSIADISICGYPLLRAEIDLEWGKFPNILLWLDRVTGLGDFVPPAELLPPV